jgi:hypothetical protein
VFPSTAKAALGSIPKCKPTFAIRFAPSFGDFHDYHISSASYLIIIIIIIIITSFINYKLLCSMFYRLASSRRECGCRLGSNGICSSRLATELQQD